MMNHIDATLTEKLGIPHQEKLNIPDKNLFRDPEY